MKIISEMIVNYRNFYYAPGLKSYGAKVLVGMFPNRALPCLMVLRPYGAF